MVLCGIMTNSDDFCPKMDIGAYRVSLDNIGQKERRGRNLCAPLEKIRGKSAATILEAVGLSEMVPVPLEPILTYLGISAVPFDFSEVEAALADFVAERGNILGMMISKGDNAGILYRKADSINRQRFTIAHELGHCALATETVSRRIEFRNDGKSNDPREMDANTFAGELLIPEKSLRVLYDETVATRVDLLAKAFAVSENVMKARLEALGLKHAA